MASGIHPEWLKLDLNFCFLDWSSHLFLADIYLLSFLCPENTIQATNHDNSTQDTAGKMTNFGLNFCELFIIVNGKIEGKMDWLGNRRNLKRDLPSVTASPRSEDRTIVTRRVIGIVMAKNTGPLLSITQICM